MTNATKALIITLANSVLAVAVAFGVSITDAQTAAITGLLNAGLAVWVALTYQNSPKRTPDA